MPPSDLVEAPETNNVDGGDAPVEEQEIVEPGEGEPAEGEVAEGGDEHAEERTAENPEGEEVPAYAKVDYSKDQSKCTV